MSASERPFLIGIAGGSGSGKSTLAERIRGALGGLRSCIVSTDAFFRQPLPTMVSPVSGKEYEDWNSPESLDLETLLGALQKQIDAGEHDVIILEGISVLYFPQIRNRLDLKLFVDLDSDERMYRRIKRNAAWGLGLDEVATYFLESAKHMEAKNFLPTKAYADLIVHGNRLDGKAVEIIAGWVAVKACAGRT